MPGKLVMKDKKHLTVLVDIKSVAKMLLYVKEKSVTLSPNSNKPKFFQNLKTVCWGGENIVPRQEWIKSGLVFNEADSLYAFGLKAVKGATKAFQLVLEAYVLKHLMFEGKSSKKMAK